MMTMTITAARYDELRAAVSETDALAAALVDWFDNTHIVDGDLDRQRLERAANLVGSVAKAAERALCLADGLNSDLLNPAIPDADPSGWDGPR